MHRQLAASRARRARRAIELRAVRHRPVGHDTGAYGSTGTVVAGTATLRAARALARGAARRGGAPGRRAEAEGDCDGPGALGRRSTCRASGWRSAGHRRGPDPAAASRRPTRARSSTRCSAGARSRAASPRRSAPRCTSTSTSTRRAGSRPGPSASTTCRSSPTCRATEVLFAATHDALGPLGAKPMSEGPFNPVAPALANAIRDATGRRLPSCLHPRPGVHRAEQAGRRPQAGWRMAGPRAGHRPLTWRPSPRNRRAPFPESG